MVSVSLFVLCMSSASGLTSFTEPVLEYDDWIAMNETAREPTKHEETHRSDDEETNNLQVLKQSYQASSGYGAPASGPEDCYLETGCSHSCGDGFRLLLPNKQAASCVSSVLQVRLCNEQECPVDCAWDHWSSWGVRSHRGQSGRQGVCQGFSKMMVFTTMTFPMSVKSFMTVLQRRDKLVMGRQPPVATFPPAPRQE